MYLGIMLAAPPAVSRDLYPVFRYPFRSCPIELA